MSNEPLPYVKISKLSTGVPVKLTVASTFGASVDKHAHGCVFLNNLFFPDVIACHKVTP
jgi:hypothetical protein